jgi:hypothetical protein
VEDQLKRVDLCTRLSPKDSKDVWKYAGNEDPDQLVDMSLEDFLNTVKRLTSAC